MMRNQLQHGLAMGLMAFFIGILAAQGPMQNFVLCMGADGHMAVESSTGPDGNCLDLPASPTPPQSSLQLLASHLVLDTDCGACRDIALTCTDARYAPAVVFAPAHSDAKASAVPVVVLALPAAYSVQPSGSDPHEQRATLSIPLHLRSTVLLI